MAELSKKLPTEPQVISLDPTYIGDVLDDIRKVGIATGKSDMADNLADSLETVSYTHLTLPTILLV